MNFQAAGLLSKDFGLISSYKLQLHVPFFFFFFEQIDDRLVDRPTPLVILSGVPWIIPQYPGLKQKVETNDKENQDNK